MSVFGNIQNLSGCGHERSHVILVSTLFQAEIWIRNLHIFLPVCEMNEYIDEAS